MTDGIKERRGLRVSSSWPGLQCPGACLVMQSLVLEAAGPEHCLKRLCSSLTPTCTTRIPIFLRSLDPEA